MLQEWNCVGTPILIALSASLCVSTTLQLPTPRHGRQRDAMAYLMEPFVPWSAEEMIADFEIRGTEAFAVGTSTQFLSEFLNRLEEQNIRVESITPLSRLALQNRLRYPVQGRRRCVLLWGAGSDAEIWVMEGKRPILWRQSALDEEVLLRELKQIALDQSEPIPLEFRGVSKDLFPTIIELPDYLADEADDKGPDSIMDFAIQEAELILSGRTTSSIEFLRDAFAPKAGNYRLQSAMRTVQFATLTLLLACGVTLYRLGEMFNQQRVSAIDQQTVIFKSLFPDLPVPVGIGSRLASEHMKLRGLRGEGSDASEQIPAIQLVECLLRSLPTDLRYRILEIRIENGRLYLVGHVREHGDADRIAEELRKVNLNVEPPSTHRLPQQGVEFRISAEMTTEDEPAVDENA